MNTIIFRRHRSLVALLGLTLVLAACGSGSGAEEVSAEADPGNWERVAARQDLIDPQPAEPRKVVVDPADDMVVLVRYENAAEPCSGAIVAVTETDDEVSISLLVGLDPNAAAMTCITGVFPYEIAVELGQPVGDRTITTTG